MAQASLSRAGRICCQVAERGTHTRRSCVTVASLPRANPQRQALAASELASTAVDRRRALLGIAVATVGVGFAAPGHVLAKSKEEKPPTIINDPLLLKAQLEAQYQQWTSGKFDAWLAGQPETIKWQTTYNGTVMKFKGKAGAKQYFTMLNQDLDIQSYKPLAIFVDNDGDEATVVVEAGGVSRVTQQPFNTIFLHMYTIGPMVQVIKFKEMTDTTLMAQLAPPPVAPLGVGAGAPAAPAAADGGEAPVEPGSAARKI